MMQKSGKVVVVSQHYPPDPSTTAAIMASISERAAQEAEVVVLSGTSGSARPAQAGKPEIVEVRNWMPGKAALGRRAPVQPHQLFRQPSTIWRFAQDLLDIVPSEILQRVEMVAGPATGGAQ